jgi:hypothetical protein
MNAALMGVSPRTLSLHRYGAWARPRRTDTFAQLLARRREELLRFLESLVLFQPDDTASNLDPADPQAVGFPQNGHGSLKVSVLFNDPNDLE